MAAAIENLSVPEWQKGTWRPRKHTNTTLALIKRQAARNPALTAAELKTSGSELAAISASLGPFTPPFCEVYSRVERFSAFLRFMKRDTFLLIRYIFRSSIPENRQIRPRVRVSHARQSFQFQKITGTLKIKKNFWKFVKTFFIHKSSVAEPVHFWPAPVFLLAGSGSCSSEKVGML